MNIPLGNQHLSLFGIRPLMAQDLTADQRNIFQRPITVPAEGVTEVADGKSAGGMTGESSSEWLRKTESYRSTAKASQQPEPEEAGQATADDPQPTQEPDSTAPAPAPEPAPEPQPEPQPAPESEPEPEAQPERNSQPEPQQPPAASTPPRRGGLAGVFGW